MDADTLQAKSKIRTNENDENNEDNYIIHTKVNKALSKELGINEIHFDNSFDWVPPKQSGLDNCNTIIPKYYHLHKNPQKIFSIDYLDMIKDDIRNFRNLNKYQLAK